MVTATSKNLGILVLLVALVALSAGGTDGTDTGTCRLVNQNKLKLPPDKGYPDCYDPSAWNSALCSREYSKQTGQALIYYAERHFEVWGEVL